MYSYDFANTVYKREQYSKHTLAAAVPGEPGRTYDIRQTTRMPLRAGNFYVNASAERSFNDKSTLAIEYMGDFTPSEKSGNETASNMLHHTLPRHKRRLQLVVRHEGGRELQLLLHHRAAKHEV